MESYIVRQPILDENQHAIGYEILYQEENGAFIQTDSSAANAIENFLMQMDGDNFLDGRIAFLNFTRNLLVRNVPRIFSNRKLVIQVEDTIIVNPLSHALVLKYKNQGFKIAIVDFEFAPRYFGILDIVDYIKVNFKNSGDSSIENIVNIGNSFGKTVIAYNVDTKEAYDRAVRCGCKCMQGAYVAEKLPSTIKKMNYLQGNFFMLMVAITKEDPDLDEIEQLISRDVTLTYQLLRLVNSAYFALRTRAKSVKQALVILGLGQLKQWIYLLSFRQDDGSMPDELIKISFLRANFCSELYEFASNLPISKSEAYLLGMFSTLHKLMDIPMEEAMKQLSVSDDIKNALITGEGGCGCLISLVKSYEKADWKQMLADAEKLNIPQNIITQKYFECVESVNATWSSLMKNNDNAVDEDEEENNNNQK